LHLGSRLPDCTRTRGASGHREDLAWNESCKYETCN